MFGPATSTPRFSTSLWLLRPWCCSTNFSSRSRPFKATSTPCRHKRAWEAPPLACRCSPWTLPRPSRRYRTSRTRFQHNRPIISSSRCRTLWPEGPQEETAVGDRQVPEEEALVVMDLALASWGRSEAAAMPPPLWVSDKSPEICHPYRQIQAHASTSG